MHREDSLSSAILRAAFAIVRSFSSSSGRMPPASESVLFLADPATSPLEAALLVTPDVIKADELLSLELWDSDRSSADDVVGKVELSIQKLIQHPGKMFPQVSKLSGMDAGSEMPGELHWEVGFFGKPKFRPALRTDGKDNNLPKELRDREEFQDDKGVIDNEHADAVSHTPPDPLWPSGICSIVATKERVHLHYLKWQAIFTCWLERL